MAEIPVASGGSPTAIDVNVMTTGDDQKRTSVLIPPKDTKKLTRRERMAELLQLEIDQLSDTEVSAILSGNIGALSPIAQAAVIEYRCCQMKLDPLTNPLIKVQVKGSNKIILYARKEAAEQLRVAHGVTVTLISEQITPDFYKVVLNFKHADGREEPNAGVEAIGAAKGEGLANAMLKAWSKALRRGTLAITGAGVSDIGDSAPGSFPAGPNS